MITSRWGRTLALAVLMLVSVARSGHAAAEVHRFNVVLSVDPMQVDGGDFNGTIDFINDTQLKPRGLEGLKRVTFAWLYEGELRYFVRPNMAVAVGVGQMRGASDREYLPQLNSAIQLHTEMLSVPVHVGGAYYLAPFNQGDFQARAYFGAGVLSLVYNRARFQQEATGVPGIPSIVTSGTQDGPGYYAEFGGHMFFASRMSVMIGIMYRSAQVKNLVDENTGLPYQTLEGQPYTLDFTGAGGRFSLAIGF